MAAGRFEEFQGIPRSRPHNFDSPMSPSGDVLGGSNGPRWKTMTPSFPTTPWLTYFDLKTSSHDSFELVSFCAAFGGKFINFR